MIVTLTANPSADRAVVLSEALQPGEVQRALSSREDAGGKGVNVAVVWPQDADAEEEKCAHRRNCATARLTSGAPFDEAHLRPPDGCYHHRKAEG